MILGPSGAVASCFSAGSAARTLVSETATGGPTAPVFMGGLGTHHCSARACISVDSLAHREEQEQIIEKSLREALKRYETMPQYEEVDSSDDDESQSQPVNNDASNQDNTMLRRRSIAKNQQPSDK